MLGPVVKSFLKETISELPETYTRKNAAGAIADLTKKGVKPEELEYAGLVLPEGKVSKTDLVSAEANRKDVFSVSENKQYDFVTIDKKGETNPTYRTKVLQYSEKGQTPEASRYASSHFEDTPNYLAHTRVYDETLDGTPTRVLTEIQSDLHQQGRQLGYGDTTVEHTAQIDDIVGLANQLNVEGLEEAIRSLNLEETSRLLSGAGVPQGNIDSIINDLSRHGETSTIKGIPKSPFEKTWLRKGLERELVDAVNEGRTQLAIPISGNVGDLSRSEGVQKWYETQVVNTAKKVAKATGSDFEMITTGASIPKFKDAQSLFKAVAETKQKYGTSANAIQVLGLGLDSGTEQLLAKGIDSPWSLSQDEINTFMSTVSSITKGETASTTYAVIKPKGQFSTSLYSTPAAGAFAAYSAYKVGKSDQEVVSELKDMGFEQDDMPEIQKQMDFITQSIEAGYSEDEIKQFIDGKEPVANEVENKPDEMYYSKPTSDFATVKGSAYQRLTSDEPMKAKDLVSSLETLHPTLISNSMSIMAYFGDKEAHRKYDEANRAAKQQIVNIAKNQFGKDLVFQPGDVGEGQWYEQTEQGLVPVDQAWYEGVKQSSGEISGGMAGAIAGFNLAPPNPYAKAAGAFIGGIAGAMAGSQVDYLREAMTLSQEMDAENMAYKAMSAAEMAAIGEVVGYGIAMPTKLAWSGIKRAKDLVLEGNTEGAMKALKDSTFMDDEQIKAITDKFVKLNPSVQGNEAQQSIQAIALTEPGMQNLIKEASRLDAKASQAAVESVNRRAKEVLETTADLTDPDVATKFKEDLANYVSDVNSFYAKVKAQAVQQPNGKVIKFNYDKLALNPILEKLHEGIQDPTVADKFLRQMQIVKSKSESRNFGDLIELRQLVNDFLYNKNISKQKDATMLRGVLNQIDGAIERNANIVMENPEQWLNDWRSARIQYSQMKQTQQQALYRLVFDKKGKVRPVQPESVVKGMTKYITALDGNWEEVMSKIPPQGRALYEGAVVDSLANKYALKMTDGTKVIDFVKLGEDLKGIQLTTPEARATKASLIELSEVFRNDPAIANITKSFDKLTINQGLTADLVTKAKFELASNTYTRLRGMLPGAAGREQDLIKQVAKLLDNPLDSKASKALADELSSDVNLSEQILELQRQEALAMAKGKRSGNVKVYANGKLKGSGPYTSIPMHRIADTDKVKTIADAESITTYSKSLDAILKKYGFLGMVDGTDRIRILK